jgi:2-deoxy-D-gluconate 3-dehydrogenase
MSERVALVTGASRGIGAGIALDLARCGFRLAITARDTDRLSALTAEINASGARSLSVALDVTDIASIEPAVERVEAELGPIELLVNNAGVNIPRPAVEVTEEQWDAIHGANLKGVFFVSQAVGKRMIARESGAIINVASAAGLIPAEDRAAYCSSKAGVVMLTKELALEWAPFGVRVNAVAPTFVETEMGALTLSRPGMRELWNSRIPLGRIASVEDVAAAVRYLASPEASFLTGVTLPVDGGLTMR